MPKASIIIATYNREKFLTQSIDSILSQTFHDYEIIIVNDGSTDSTKEILDKYKSIKNINIIHQENLGISAARNNGFKYCNGKYIAFLDDDDIWHKNYLKEQVNILDKNEDYIASYCQCNLINEHKKKIYFNKKRNYHGYIFKKLLELNYIYPSSIIIRRGYLEKVLPFKDDIAPADDWEVFLRLAPLGKIYFLNKTLVYIRKHSTQLTKLNDLHKIEEQIQIRENIFQETFKINHIDDCYKNFLLGNFYLQFSRTTLQAYHYDRTKELLELALKYNPKLKYNFKWQVFNLISDSHLLQRLYKNYVKYIRGI